MDMFLYICDYFKITPKNFFDKNSDFPFLLGEIINDINSCGLAVRINPYPTSIYKI